jgi:hypothetical protein
MAKSSCILSKSFFAAVLFTARFAGFFVGAFLATVVSITAGTFIAVLHSGQIVTHGVEDAGGTI